MPPSAIGRVTLAEPKPAQRFHVHLRLAASLVASAMMAAAASGVGKAPAASAAGTRVIQDRYVAVRVGAAEFPVTRFGARGDGQSNDTAAIQKAFDAAAAAGGGAVVFPPPGRYLTAALTVPAPAIEVRVPVGATLLVSDDMTAWPANRHVLEVSGVHDIAITGGGTWDGQGLAWWRAMAAKPDLWRPHMVDASHATNMLVKDTTFLNAPNHVLELGANRCEVARVKVLSPPSTGDCERTKSCSHNTDAVDVHGEPFWVHSVNFSTGDDNVAIHANGTVVEDSFFGSGHGASIGSLCNDWITNVTFRNITFDGTTTGCRIKSHPGCAGRVWSVTYANLTMHDVGQAILLTQFYSAPPHPSPSTMRFDGIRFVDVGVHAGDVDSIAASNLSPAIDIDCDDGSDQRNGNCRVDFDTVVFYGDSGKGGMECKGVTGTAEHLAGVSTRGCRLSSQLQP